MRKPARFCTSIVRKIPLNNYMIRYYTSILAKQLYLCQANFQYFFIFFENFPIQHLFTHTLPPYSTFGLHKKRLFCGLYARSLHRVGGRPALHYFVSICGLVHPRGRKARSMSVAPGAKKHTHQRVTTREEIVQVSKY